MRRNKDKPYKFESEAELCSNLMDAARAEGFKVYPETSGWDILLERDGVQLGIQAKLHANFSVVAQALPSAYYWQKRPRPAKGPAFRCVAVPKCDGAFKHVCMRCKIVVMTPDTLGRFDLRYWKDLAFYDWKPELPSWVPPFEPDLQAGVPSPVSVTPWKLKAVKLSLLLLEQGFITTKDASAFGINIKGWVQSKWIKQSGQKQGRLTRYVRTEKRLPHERFPEAIVPGDYEPYTKLEGKVGVVTRRAFMFGTSGLLLWVPKSVLKNGFDSKQGERVCIEVEESWLNRLRKGSPRRITAGELVMLDKVYEYFDGELVKERPKAVCVVIEDDGEYWIPKSQLEEDVWNGSVGDLQRFGVTQWWAQKEGLL